MRIRRRHTDHRHPDRPEVWKNKDIRLRTEEAFWSLFNRTYHQCEDSARAYWRQEWLETHFRDCFEVFPHLNVKMTRTKEKKGHDAKKIKPRLQSQIAVLLCTRASDKAPFDMFDVATVAEKY